MKNFPLLAGILFLAVGGFLILNKTENIQSSAPLASSQETVIRGENPRIILKGSLVYAEYCVPEMGCDGLTLLPEADSVTIQPLPLQSASESYKYLYTTFMKDKSYVYAGGTLITGADPKTFIAVNDKCGYDNTHTYWTYLPIVTSDDKCTRDPGKSK